MLNDRAGAQAVEFALIAPVLLMLLFGMAAFGIYLNNDLELTDAVRSGSRQLAISRSTTTPWTTATTAVTASAANLTASNIGITLAINGTACTSDSACTSALSSAQGEPASVTATYPCDLTIMGVNYAPSCTLSSTSTERIE